MGQTSSSSSTSASNLSKAKLDPSSTEKTRKMENDDNQPIVSPVVAEQRVIPVVSWPAFAITVSLLPVWAATVVPLSIFYQGGKSLVRKLARRTPSIPSHDSEHAVDPSALVPRPERKYDVVVLGVTGFCGKLAARYLAKTYGMDGRKVKWAMAGRSRAKLEQVRSEIASELGAAEEHVKVDMIVADTSDPTTLPDLVRQTRVVASTAGPFILMGSHVVEFCAKFGTHYVDITGEVDWAKSMHGLWHDTAVRTGSKVVSFCGAWEVLSDVFSTYTF
jgi:Saccharopine dehydrogenase NADP binding domain